MLSARLLNSDASLNNFEYQDAIEFVPGEDKVFAFQLWNKELELRWIPGDSAVVTLTFNKVDGTTLTKTASFINAGDRSLISVTLTDEETPDLLSGNITFTVDVAGDESDLKKGVILNALQRVDTTA